MRLYPGKVDSIAAEIITTLTQAGDIEVSDNNEAQLDSAAVLKEYIRVDKELTERAKDILEIRGLPYSPRADQASARGSEGIRSRRRGPVLDCEPNARGVHVVSAYRRGVR